MTQKGDISEVLPLITLYAFAGYRLLPALQQVYAAISQLRYSSAALKALCADVREAQYLDIGSKDIDKFDFDSNIILKDINFPTLTLRS